MRHVEPESYWETPQDTFYVDRHERVWIVQSLDGAGPNLPQQTSTVPNEAEQIEDTGRVVDLEESVISIEAGIVTQQFKAWLDSTSFAGIVEVGDLWATFEAFPSEDTMRSARECFDAFHAGDLQRAETSMHRAQQPFV